MITIPNYRQLYAKHNNQRKQLLAVNPKLNDKPGIYFLLRTDEYGIRHAYIGQTRQGILSRMVSHLNGYQQHIDRSIKKYSLWSKDNPHGWRIEFFNCPIDKLDAYEKYYIKLYADAGHQMKNQSLGGQAGERLSGNIGERKSPKTYTQGKHEGFKRASKEIDHLFDLHLDVKTKSDKPNKNQEKALEKFKDFLDYWKGENN